MTLTRNDVLLAATLALLSLVPLALRETPEARYAEIRVDGALYRTVQLSAHHGTEDIVIETAHGTNTIRVTDDSIAVVAADCPDAICVQTGAVRAAGATIACLPHRLIIEVKGDSAENDLIMTR